ncbi:uncharacterized protein Hap1MRO34_006678 isoform 1-T1 [Clarias gariepinus]
MNAIMVWGMLSFHEVVGTLIVTAIAIRMCSVLVVFCWKSKVYYPIFGGVGGFTYTTFLIFESWALFQNGDKKFTTWDACLAAGTIFVNTSSELTLPDLVPPP